MKSISDMVASMANDHKSNRVVYTPSLRNLFGIKEDVRHTQLPDNPPADFNKWINYIFNQRK